MSMQLIKILMWLGILLVFYSYIGYAAIIWLINKGKKNNTHDVDKIFFEPVVSIIVAAYNEEDIIKRKIENCFQLNYPAEKLKFIFVADGSSDDTVKIIQQFPEVELLYKEDRLGKVAAVNRAVTFVKTDYIIFCDANTFLNKNCVREIVKHYTNENIGAVAGEKKVADINNTNAPGAAKDGEGLYWKYESKLKKIDSDFYSVVGAAGELFSIRTTLFEPLASNILLDDFIMSMEICKKGYRVVYEPKAFATEAPSLSMQDEQKRKIRISAGGFQSILMLKDLLNIFKYGRLSFLYISHRVSRWVVCPVMLPLIFICNFLIVLQSLSFSFVGIFIIQCVFYFTALLGWLFSLNNIKVNLFYVPYYFVFMNVALYIGFFRFLNNKQTVLWHKAKRK
jgi:poly-beta-1,6-N-acetyl-D-glucosamine synthase